MCDCACKNIAFGCFGGTFNINSANPGGSGLTNPMTTLGDMIYGGASGVPTRLPGNATSSTRNILFSIASSGSATAPQWSTLTQADLPGTYSANNPVLYYNGTNIVSTNTNASATNYYLSQASNGAPGFRQISASTDLTGITPVANGGTGNNNLGTNTVVCGNGTSATYNITNSTSTAMYVKQVSNGVIAFAQVAFGDLSGNATVTQGGTGLTACATGDILYGSATNTLSRLAGNASGSTRTILFSIASSGSATAPQWTTLTQADLPGTYSANNPVLYYNGTNIVSVTPNTGATNLYLVQVNSGAPAFQQVQQTDLNNEYNATTSTYSATAADFIITGDTTAGAYTITLPAATSVTAGKMYIIKFKTKGSTNSLTINGGGTNIESNLSNTFASTLVMSTQGTGGIWVSDGSVWRCVAAVAA
jgi:hypothetical protein